VDGDALAHMRSYLSPEAMATGFAEAYQMALERGRS
jgi:hypothetical protein